MSISPLIARLTIDFGPPIRIIPAVQKELILKASNFKFFTHY